MRQTTERGQRPSRINCHRRASEASWCVPVFRTITFHGKYQSCSSITSQFALPKKWRQIVKCLSAAADWGCRYCHLRSSEASRTVVCGRDVQENSGSVKQKQIIISSHQEKLATDSQVCQRGHRQARHTRHAAPTQTAVALTATDGRQRRLQLSYVFRCSETITFRGY